MGARSAGSGSMAGSSPVRRSDVNRLPQNAKGLDGVGAPQVWSAMAVWRLYMFAIVPTIGGASAAHHFVQVGAGYADVTEQMVVEVEHVGVRPTLGR
jgi:hypothetical protein